MNKRWLKPHSQLPETAAPLPLATDAKLLHASRIMAGLDPVVQDNVVVQTRLITGSTNEDVHALANTHEGKLPICLADYQTAGRGRRGRAWCSPFGASIALSLLWRLCDTTVPLDGLSLMIGLAVLTALTTYGATGLALKWPNDLLWHQQKLCGMLLEAQGGPSTQWDVVIGIGINCQFSEAQLAAINQPATDLSRICGQSIDRNRVASLLINTLYQMLNAYRNGGFARFHKQWCQHDAYLGKAVTVITADQRITGRSLGVNAQGRLLLDTPRGIQVFHEGDVSLRTDS